MNIKKTILLLSFAMVLLHLSAQIEETIIPEAKQRNNRSFAQKLFVASDLELNFGNVTYIKVAPLLGVNITERFMAGLGPIYIYERYKFDSYLFKTSTYGATVFSSFIIFRNISDHIPIDIGDILIHAENELLNIERYEGSSRIWIDNLLLGGGMYYPMGGRFGIALYVLWDTTQNKYSPYYNSNPALKFRLFFHLGKPAADN